MRVIVFCSQIEQVHLNLCFKG